ncbi:H-NS histone family protein [Marinobacterium arenosum]|uniref:H-NS histone family protein n=1 Tax=Marinobacterium arenosum TaxID=2862496 RepID=UPI001C959D65|nr:H-NS histone family protein [Marinobacterium arenosum]MBY4677569.1 H-NS histone family protein [Marinobacterium arenosum]
MSEFIKTLTRKNSLRKQCQELAVADIEKVLDDLKAILEEKQEEEQARIEAEAEKTAKIEAIRKSMLEAGIDLSDLEQLVDTAPKKKVAPKYRIVDANGVTHEWSGRGRTPLAFQEYFDSGKTKEDCLIK